jgi:hypothetical protein
VADNPKVVKTRCANGQKKEFKGQGAVFSLVPFDLSVYLLVLMRSRGRPRLPYLVRRLYNSHIDFIDVAMIFHVMREKPDKKMVIIASYFSGESYGLLGPQIAATIIQENAPYVCKTVAVSREDDKQLIKKALAEYFHKERPIIGFSSLSGREDLFDFALELKQEGATTILAGPQADVDYRGEKGWEKHPHRFQGLHNNFSFALVGPAEQIIALLRALDEAGWRDAPGLLYSDKTNRFIQNPRVAWEERYLKTVKWDNLYRIQETGVTPVKIATGQVLQQIGCPYAARKRLIAIDYPAFLTEKTGQKIRFPVKGCSFCDIAIDKGFYGALDLATVMSQIRALPEHEDKRKIPFELINENPLPGLPRLLTEVRNEAIRVSQINLIMRADWFIKGEKHVKEALKLAGDMGARILLQSIGLESFDDRILSNLNKGVTVETNLGAIRLMRRLKEEFPHHWEYSNTAGAIHGFIHPTPWDTPETAMNTQRAIGMYALHQDILPRHSTPLVIHHASFLGDWIREIEGKEGIRFKRYGSVIGWWPEALL